MKKTLLTFCMGLIITSQAQSYKIDTNSTIQVQWSAYKTLGKLSVKGVFDGVKIAPKKEAKTLTALLDGVSASIDTSSVNTQNQERDKTLRDSFFDKLAQQTITAKIIEVTPSTTETDKGTLKVSIVMNSINKIIPMKYAMQNDALQAVGTIDLFDFNAKEALESINKSCYTLHEGKTWNDVEIAFELHIDHLK